MSHPPVGSRGRHPKGCCRRIMAAPA